MVFHVSGKKLGNGRKMITKIANARANRLIGRPHLPRRKGACVGISPCQRLIMKNVIGMMYERYSPTDAKDRIASRATVEPRLMSMINIMMMLTRKRELVGMRRVGWT
jgi:hypothetical protein